MIVSEVQCFEKIQSWSFDFLLFVGGFCFLIFLFIIFFRLRVDELSCIIDTDRLIGWFFRMFWLWLFFVVTLALLLSLLWLLLFLDH